MSTLEEKRAYIMSEIEKELAKEPLTLSFSSPHIKGARPFVIMRAEPDELQQEFSEEAEDAFMTEHDGYEDPPKREDQESFPDDEEEDEELTAKQQAKLEKLKAKEEKRNEKAYDKMRRDIKKRGFGTGILKELDDPADIYSLSDDDIRQIEVAGLINDDGYYTFTYPEDFGDLEKQRFPKKMVLLFAGFAAAVILLTVILVNNIIAIF